MKQLKFEHNYAAKIIAGDKQATFRVNDDKDLKPGDIVELIDKVDRDRPASWLIPGELEITEVTQLPISNLTKEHLLRGESFRNKEEMIQTFRRFYGDHIDENTLVTVLTFKYINFKQPKTFVNQLIARDVTTKAQLYADGGSRGNPGPSALGFVVMTQEKLLLHAEGKYLGITTNNQAEYHALIAGMDWCIKHGVRELSIYLDSMLVVNQMNGSFKVKNRDLWSLYERATESTKHFRSVHFQHVPRELNKLADTEVNKALDAVKGNDIVQ